jgi:hypothetical protein
MKVYIENQAADWCCIEENITEAQYKFLKQLFNKLNKSYCKDKDFAPYLKIQKNKKGLVSYRNNI